MLRSPTIAVLTAAGLFALAVAPAWSQQEPQTAPPAPSLPSAGELLAEVLGPALPKLDPAELAGMAPGTNPAALTLPQAYSLKLILTRDPGGTPPVTTAGTFDPTALDERARRSDTTDFDRFRSEFLGSEFRDPAPRFFAALRHRYSVNSAREQVAFASNMHALFEQLIRTETSGVSQLQIDQTDGFLQLSRQSLAIDFTEYRTSVDDLKVSLGLPPSTPLVLDEQILAPFEKAFSALDRWQRNPNQKLQELSALIDRLPRLQDPRIGEHSLTEVINGSLPEEAFLLNCVAVARQHRAILKDDQSPPDARNVLTLEIRRSARSLILSQKNYEIGRNLLGLKLREIDQWSEQLVAPRPGGRSPLATSANVATQTLNLLTAQTQLYKQKNQLVSSWLKFKEDSTTLHRELGIMPYDGWEAFHRSFLAAAAPPAGETAPLHGEAKP